MSSKSLPKAMVHIGSPARTPCTVPPWAGLQQAVIGDCKIV